MSEQGTRQIAREDRSLLGKPDYVRISRLTAGGRVKLETTSTECNEMTIREDCRLHCFRWLEGAVHVRDVSTPEPSRASRETGLKVSEVLPYLRMILLDDGLNTRRIELRTSPQRGPDDPG